MNSNGFVSKGIVCSCTALHTINHPLVFFLLCRPLSSNVTNLCAVGLSVGLSTAGSVSVFKIHSSTASVRFNSRLVETDTSAVTGL